MLLRGCFFNLFRRPNAWGSERFGFCCLLLKACDSETGWKPVPHYSLNEISRQITAAKRATASISAAMISIAV